VLQIDGSVKAARHHTVLPRVPTEHTRSPRDNASPRGLDTKRFFEELMQCFKRNMANDRGFHGLGGDKDNDVADPLDLFQLKLLVADINQPRVVLLTTGFP
jgi:hypothetical protein